MLQPDAQEASRSVDIMSDAAYGILCEGKGLKSKLQIKIVIQIIKIE